MINDLLPTSIALLIDGDNISPDFAEKVLSIAQQYGTVVIKRVYADFSLPQHGKWKNCIFENGMRAIHTYSYTKGKNTTDIALVIDAMDLMCAKKAEIFCIASSDSDFTQLAVRLQENGIKVIGLGRFCTNLAFVKACAKFHYLDNDSENTQELVIDTEIPDLSEPEQAENCNDESVIQEDSPKDDIMATPLKKPSIESESSKLPGLTIVGKVDLSGMDMRTGKKLKPTNKTEDTLQPGEITFTKPIDAIFLSRFHETFIRLAGTSNGTVLLSQLSETLREIINFTPKQYGFSNFRQLCEALPPTYVVVIHADGCTCSLKLKAA